MAPTPELPAEPDWLVTVAIPTFNGAARFPDVLAALRAQVGTDAFRWEILVVDNAGTDDAEATVQRHQCDGPSKTPLRYVREPRPGAAFARMTAGREARGRFIGFLDDDNIPGADWVAQIAAFGQAHPRAGAWASRIAADYFEAEPPPHFNRIECYLGTTDLGPDPVQLRRGNMLPPCAGLAVRREAWCACAPAEPFFPGRIRAADGSYGYRTAGAEDLEPITHLALAGWEVWYNPAMTVRHRIPAQRFGAAYLVPVFRGMGRTRFYTRMLRLPAWQRPFFAPLYFFNDLRKWLLHRYRYRDAPPDDVVVASERQFYAGALASPFLHLRYKLLGR